MWLAVTPHSTDHEENQEHCSLPYIIRRNVSSYLWSVFCTVWCWLHHQSVVGSDTTQHWPRSEPGKHEKTRKYRYFVLFWCILVIFMPSQIGRFTYILTHICYSVQIGTPKDTNMSKCVQNRFLSLLMICDINLWAEHAHEPRLWLLLWSQTMDSVFSQGHRMSKVTKTWKHENNTKIVFRTYFTVLGRYLHGHLVGYFFMFWTIPIQIGTPKTQKDRKSSKLTFHRFLTHFHGFMTFRDHRNHGQTTDLWYIVAQDHDFGANDTKTQKTRK